MKPKRIQLSRKKGFSLQLTSYTINGREAVNCARPSKWGNPHRVNQLSDNPQLDMMDAQHGVCFTNEAAVNRFKRHVKVGLPPFTRKQIRAELRGKNLACWCKPGQPCHCDILLKIANS